MPPWIWRGPRPPKPSGSTGPAAPTSRQTKHAEIRLRDMAPPFVLSLRQPLGCSRMFGGGIIAALGFQGPPRMRRERRAISPALAFGVRPAMRSPAGPVCRPTQGRGGRLLATGLAVHTGRRRGRGRRLLGLTKQQLAGACGVRFQQIQKYECGANRISAARLWSLSAALDVPIGYFYDGLTDAERAAANDSGEDVKVSSKETMDLIRAYY